MPVPTWARIGYAILKRFRVNPLSLFDAEATEQGEMGGGSPEPDKAETKPLTSNGGKRTFAGSRRPVYSSVTETRHF
jgi:hypothetical protein